MVGVSLYLLSDFNLDSSVQGSVDITRSKGTSLSLLCSSRSMTESKFSKTWAFGNDFRACSIASPISMTQTTSRGSFELRSCSVHKPAPINNTFSLNGGGSGGIGAFATTENAGVAAEAEASGSLWREVLPLLEKQEDKFAHLASSDLLESVSLVEKLNNTRFG